MSEGQFAALCFLALLSPLVRLLPGAAARAAGGVCWAGVIPALGALALLGWLFLRFAEKEPGGMAVMIRRCLGPVFGRIVTALYALAFVFYTGFILRVGADRLIATVYPKSGPAVFTGVMLLLCRVAAQGSARALGRAAVILRNTMLAVLALVFAMAAKGVDLSLLSLPAPSDAGRILRGALPVINVGGFCACFSFLGGSVERTGRGRRLYFRWLCVFSALTALLCVTVTGRLGPTLTGQLRYPFFTVIRDLSLLHLSDRVEALIVGMWVFSDFILCTAMLRGAQEALRVCVGGFSRKAEGWVLTGEAAAAALVAAVIAQSSAALRLWSDELVPKIFAALVFLGFPLIALAGKARKRI